MNSQEQWLPICIENVKPYYYISNLGRVYSNATNQFIIPHKNHNGYLQVSLMTETGRIFRKVHRLVLLTFAYFPGCELLQVDHKNYDKCDNRLCNLEWVTPKENIKRAIDNNLRDSIGENNANASITNNDALLISNMILAGKSDSEIANTIGCTESIVKCIAFGKTWSHLFTDERKATMLATRTGHYMPDDVKHKICKYFENNTDKKVINLCKRAILNANFELTDRSLRLAKRLYYRYQDHNITQLYNY